MKLSLVGLCFLLSINIFAEDKSGGCGLGWRIAKENSMISFSTRATTNTYTMTFGTTSGTSGCAKHSIVLNEKLQHHFTEANFDEVIVGIATGRGETLTALSRSFGCNDAVTDHFATSMKKNFSNLKVDHPVSLVNSLGQAIKNDQKLSANCHII